MRHLIVLLLGWLIATAVIAAAMPARAQTIDNIAYLNGPAGTVASNPVSIALEHNPATLAVYRPDPVATPVTIRNPLCQRAASRNARFAIASTQRALGGITPSRDVHAGQPLIFSVMAPEANHDPAAVESVTVKLTTSAGDRETLTVYETGANTGEFIGAITTRAAPPAPVAGDCALTFAAGDQVKIEARDQNNVLAAITIDALIDPLGMAFDSEDGTPVSGTIVTLIDATTGQPAAVFGDDGISHYPSTVITGQDVTDATGQVYTVPAGEYRFPQVAAGRYRLKVEPPSPYAAPSKLTPAQLAALVRSDGRPLMLNDASYGGVFVLAGTDTVRNDIPLDRPPVAVGLTKTASRGTASPGDAVLYTITARNPDPLHGKRGVTVTDVLPAALRLKADSVRIDGVANPAAVTLAADGRTVTASLGTLAPAAIRTVTYILTVRPDAPAGQAINRATVMDVTGATASASVAVRIDRETIAARMTIIGRITDGGCGIAPAAAHGIAGIRVMLEDGSYAITDRDGRYHFDGVVPGDHVVQVDPASLPAGGRFTDCTRSTRAAGSALSRFVTGQGGSLVSADFHATLDAATATVESDAPTPVSDRVAAGAERDWFAGGKADIAWLFPEPEYNPRSPSVRVAIRHLPGQVVTLYANGKPVETVAFDGTRKDATQTFAIRLWRGVPLSEGVTHLVAEVRGGKDGPVVATMTRDVRFVTTAAHADYLADKSRLIADGIKRPIIAVRLVDRDGHPVHAGTVGDITVSAPYLTALEIDAEQTRTLAGLGRAKPVWHVTGDDGIAYIALAPTTVSGAVTITFTFRDRDAVRTQTVETWLEPAQRDWTIVGLAQGQLARAGIAGHVEPLDRPEKLRAEGRIAFYAKGRVLGKYLLTLAYDSAKKREDQRLGGAIDPETYYTVYADRSERRFDAASVRKLYVKLEARQFYALFGDFETGFNETELGRYQRAATGFKAELRTRHVAASAFAAEITTHHRRDEIQGNGLSGPYALSARSILANSEQIVIETRDRLRSDRIVDRRTLTRFVDYDIDYAAGTIRFSAPVLSRSSNLDPQFIVADYEIEGDSQTALNAGARVRYSAKDGRIRIGATAIHDAGDQGRTDLLAADARVRLGQGTEIRAELAASRSAANQAGVPADGAAWLIEAEHHDGKLDLLGYARQQSAGFGVAQQNTAERGRRKIGGDARVALTDRLSVSGSAWIEDSLTDPSSRRAAQAKLDWRGEHTDLHIGVIHADDHLADGRDASSTLLEGGAAQRFFGNRLQLDASTSIALGKGESIDFPAQHKIGARFAVSNAVTLVGGYEIAHGSNIDARTARIGFDLKPWAGAKLTSAVADQALTEYGHRTYAAYGLAQSVDLGKHWSLDATIDGNRTLSGIDPARVLNPAQPVASGGYVGSGNLITEDFTAVTLGLAYRGQRWAATARGEYRFGSLGDRAAATFGLIRQLGEGSALGALASWSRVSANGTTTSVTDIAASGAFRPASSALAMLGKIEYRADQVTGAVAGNGAPAGGGILTVTGNARSSRLVASLSADWAPYGRDSDGLYQRSEVSVFLGARYVTDRIDTFDLKGLTTMIGADARIGVSDWLELGASGTVRGDLGAGNFNYAFGPTIGVRPAKNMLITAGYNVSGFADRDFAAARATTRGPFLAVRLKFDQTSFGFLGLGRR